MKSCLRWNRLTSRWLLGLALAASAWSGHASTASAEEVNPHELQLTTQRVIVFKDGYYLVIKHGTATADKQGDVFCDDVPDAAVLGSFWATADKGRVVSMTAGWETVKKSVDKEVSCTQPIEILKANIGRAARIELSDRTVFKGEIREMLADETRVGVPEVFRSTFGLPSLTEDSEPRMSFSSRRSARPRESLTATISMISGSQCIIRTEEGDVLLPVNQIKTVVVKDMQTKIRRTVTTTERTKRLTLRLEQPGQRSDVTMMYFRPGLRWIPTYRVGLMAEKAGPMSVEKKRASVALQAEFINEAEDLRDVPIDIVVGVSNFRFHDTPSPLVLEQVMRNALHQAAPQLMNQMSNMNNGFVNSAYVVNSRRTNGNDDGEGSLRIPSELTSAGAQDLFVYSLPKLSLAKGQRSAVSIFSAEVPYRDVYTWDLHVTRADVDTSPSARGLKSPLNIVENKVWHQIVLTNTTKLPWTTGAALLLQGSQPLAQEMLTYTSPTDDVRVPITVAVDVRGSYSEKEFARKLNDLSWDGWQYARIDKQGALNICNHKKIPVDLEITLHGGGKADEASHDGKVVLGAFEPGDWNNYRGSPAVNNSSTVTWRTKLKPGETFEPSVKYHYFTRH